MNDIENSRNILRFTLGIPGFEEMAEIKGTISTSYIIDGIYDLTWEACEKYLPKANFFGKDYAIKPLHNLAYMNTYSYYQKYWKIHFKQQVIFRAYKYLRAMMSYAGEADISAYQMLQLFVGRTQEECPKGALSVLQGLDWTLQKKITRLDNMQISYAASEKEKVSNKVPSYKKRIRDLSNIVIGTDDEELGKYFLKTKLKIQNGKKEVGMVQFNHAELVALLNNHKVDFKYIVNTRNQLKEGMINSYLKSVAKIREYVLKNSSYSQSDKAYLLDMLEDLFDFELVDCLYQNIVHLEEAGKLPVVTQAEVDMIAACSVMPNNFSRKYHLQMAVDSLIDESIKDKKIDFFSDTSNGVESWGSYGDKSPDMFFSSDELALWNIRYKKFIKYLSSFVFPVYESYFFTALYSSLSKKGSSQKVYSEMYRVLKQYINKESLFNLRDDTLTRPETSELQEQCRYPKCEVIKPWQSGIEDKSLYCKCIAAVKKCKGQKREGYLLSLQDITNAFPGYERALPAWYTLNTSKL